MAPRERTKRLKRALDESRASCAAMLEAWEQAGCPSIGPAYTALMAAENLRAGFEYSAGEPLSPRRTYAPQEPTPRTGRITAAPAR
jgi:hypothetical protein